MLFFIETAFAAGAAISITIPRDEDRPRIIDTTPDDGSSLNSAAPQLICVWDRDMDTTRVSGAKVTLPNGLTPTALSWSDARTLVIIYSGSLPNFGAKRVDLHDNYFLSTIGNAALAGQGFAFNYADPNTPPFIVTGPTASPLGLTPNEPMEFSALAFDPDGDPVELLWDFGDGSTATGSPTTHTFTGEGPYLVVLTVRDNRGGQASGSILLSTETSERFPWAIQKTLISMNFKKASVDKITVGGVIDLPAGYSLAGKKANVDVGGVAFSYTLDAKGKAKSGKNSMSMKVRLVKKQFLGGAVKVTFTMTGSFSAKLAAIGLTNSDSKGKSLPVRFLLSLSGRAYDATVNVLYTAKTGKTGKAKQAGRVR